MFVSNEVEEIGTEVAVGFNISKLWYILWLECLEKCKTNSTGDSVRIRVKYMVQMPSLKMYRRDDFEKLQPRTQNEGIVLYQMP
jgi:hypothetical protein